MIDTKDGHRSLLIPKWLSIYRDGVEDFHFDGQRNLLSTERSNKHLDLDLASFFQNPSVTLASILLHESIVLDRKQVTMEMALYLSRRDIPNSLRNLVDKIIHDTEVTHSTCIDTDIRRIKKALNLYPRNALLWIEQSRHYTIKGQEAKAKKSALFAHAIAPGNRYVSRAVARLFIHYDELDIACELLKRSYKANPDPMIRATHINCAILANQRIPVIRKSEIGSVSGDKAFSYSELLCTHGILEMQSGDDRSAKKFFKRSWEHPTQNVISHAEWTIRNTFPGLISSVGFDFDDSSEAAMWRRYCVLDLTGAMEMAVKWMLEEPYSTHPYLAGSAIACYSEQCSKAIAIAKKGLEGNPHDYLLQNNLAYALIKEGRTIEARTVLSCISERNDDIEKSIIIATTGYCSYKEGDSVRGRRLYLNSIQMLKKSGQSKLAVKVLLCLAIAEIETNTETAVQSIEEALEQSKTYKDPDILLLRHNIQSMMHDRYVNQQ